MRWFLIIMGILLVLFVLFCLLRLGVLVKFGDTASAWISIGPIKLQVAPSKPGKEKKPQKKQKKTEKPKENGEALDKLKKIPRPTMEDIRSAYQTLWPPMKKALRRTRRGIRIDPLQVSVVLGGKEDPAAAAELYGYLNAGVWTAMPVLEQLLVIPDPAIHLETDFASPNHRAAGSVGLSIRMGTLLAVGLQVGIPALKWLLKYWKKHRKKTKRPVPQEISPAETTAA